MNGKQRSIQRGKSLFVLRYIKLSSPKLNNLMVIGAMHIHLAILLFAFERWLLQRGLLGHACMVWSASFPINEYEYVASCHLVTHLSLLRRIFFDVRFDVFKNSSCLSNLYVTGSTFTSVQSKSLAPLKSLDRSTLSLHHLAVTRPLSPSHLWVSLCHRCCLCLSVAGVRSSSDYFHHWIGKASFFQRTFNDHTPFDRYDVWIWIRSFLMNCTIVIRNTVKNSYHSYMSTNPCFLSLADISRRRHVMFISQPWTIRNSSFGAFIPLS